jgi:hypothetical protein
MGVIETEFLNGHFEGLLRLLASAAPIPAPTFDVLGADRLIGSLSWASVTVAAAPPGLVTPPGAVAARADVTIGHASIVDLTANPAAMTFTSATVWLFVGVSAAPHRLTLGIARIDVAGSPVTAPFTPPLPLQLATLPTAIGLPAGVTALGQAVLVADGVCTIRFVTSTNEALLAPPANRATALSEGWVIHVSGEVVAEQLLHQLELSLKNLGPDIEVERQPTAAWIPFSRNLWGALGGFGVKKVDACADVDISVDVNASVFVSADRIANTLTTVLELTSDASDWDAFRCWLAEGGLVAAVFLPPLGIDTLAAVGFRVGTGAGDAINDNAPAGTWEKVSGGDSSATYRQVTELRVPVPTFSAIDDNPTIDGSGLVISGTMSPILPAVHAEPHFSPNGGELRGVWVGGFSCKTNAWSQALELPYVEIIDQALVGLTPFARLAVKIFPTSSATPATLWSIEPVTGGFDETAHIVSHADAADHPANSRRGRTPSGFAFIHTTAGLKRFDLGPIPASRVPPDELHLIPMRVNCRNFGEEWLDPRIFAEWLVDPPEIDLEHAPLRQWLLTISEVPLGTNITILGLRGRETTLPLASVTAQETGQLAIEVITDADTELAIDHTFSVAPPGARLSQRWLLPTLVTEFQGAAKGLVQNGNEVHVIAADHPLVSLSTVTSQVRRVAPAAATPFSLTLADGRVAAIHGNSLVIAIPHGGTAARTLRARKRPESSHDYGDATDR